jgi:hypothetical protein
VWLKKPCARASRSCHDRTPAGQLRLSRRSEVAHRGLGLVAAVLLEEVFAVLGVPVRPLLPDPAEFGGNGSIRFEAGPGGDAETLRRLSPSEGAIRIGEAMVHTYYMGGRLELRLSDETEPWRVTDTAVAAASAIEVDVARLASRVIDPPQDDELCISPKHHPEIWETPTERAPEATAGAAPNAVVVPGCGRLAVRGVRVPAVGVTQSSDIFRLPLQTGAPRTECPLRVT